MIQTSIRQQLCHGTMMIGLGILGYPSDEKKTVDSPKLDKSICRVSIINCPRVVCSQVAYPAIFFACLLWFTVSDPRLSNRHEAWWKPIGDGMAIFGGGLKVMKQSRSILDG